MSDLMRDAIQALADALQAMVDNHVRMVNSGDCGNWDPEAENQIIQARAALAVAAPYVAKFKKETP
jgi:hypothetical protein